MNLETFLNIDVAIVIMSFIGSMILSSTFVETSVNTFKSFIVIFILLLSIVFFMNSEYAKFILEI